MAEIGSSLAGCGGWSCRKTLYGGDALDVRDEERLDPQVDAARLRAFYTHPDFVRRGAGRALIARCEIEAWSQGFSTMDLVATLAGAPLYESCGYVAVRDIFIDTANGVDIPAKMMTKSIAPAVTRSGGIARASSNAA